MTSLALFNIFIGLKFKLLYVSKYALSFVVFELPISHTLYAERAAFHIFSLEDRKGLHNVYT